MRTDGAVYAFAPARRSRPVTRPHLRLLTAPGTPERPASEVETARRRSRAAHPSGRGRTGR